MKIRLLRLWLGRPSNRLLLVLILTSCAVFGGRASAAAVNGSASIWSYLRDDSTKHVQLVPMLTFNLREFGIPSLRFESALRGYTDVRHGKSEDRQLRLWRAVFVYTPEKSPWEVRLGQQWLTEGVGRGNVAGLWVRRKIDAVSQVTIYGGGRLINSIDLQETNRYQGFMVGAHGRSMIGRFNVGASYAYIGKDKVLYQGAGVEASGRIGHRVMGRGRFDINLERGSAEKAQLGLYWTAAKNVDVHGEFRLQQPRIFEDSYFTRFLGEVKTTYGRAGALWKFYHNFYARGTGTVLFSESPDALWKAQAAVGAKCFEVGYTHWLSVDKAKWDGVFGELHYDYRTLGRAFAGFDFAHGSNAETTLLPARDSQSLYFGAEVTPFEALSLAARAEQITDPLYKNQWRGLFSLVTRFSNLR